MHGPAHSAWGYCPVRRLNRHALVALPERVEESNATPVSEQLLSIVNSDVLSDQVASAIRDALAGHIIGATVTLSLTRAQTRVLLPDGAGRPAGLEADAAFAGEMTERLAGVGQILEQSAAEACSNLAGQLHRALGELDAVIKDVRTAVAHRQPGPED